MPKARDVVEVLACPSGQCMCWVIRTKTKVVIKITTTPAWFGRVFGRLDIGRRTGRVASSDFNSYPENEATRVYTRCSTKDETHQTGLGLEVPGPKEDEEGGQSAYVYRRQVLNENSF